MTCNLVIFGIVLMILAFAVPISSLVLTRFGISQLFKFFWDTKSPSDYITGSGLTYLFVFFFGGLLLTIYGSNNYNNFNNIKNQIFTMKKIKSKNYIKESTIPNSGYGFFAGKNYKKGDVIETNIFIYLDLLDEYKKKNNTFGKYFFKCVKNNKKIILPLGNILLMNHSNNPNAFPYNFNYNNRTVTCIALKNIKRGEEIFINYGKDYSYSWK